jgi:hypothetical protein
LDALGKKKEVPVATPAKKLGPQFPIVFTFNGVQLEIDQTISHPKGEVAALKAKKAAKRYVPIPADGYDVGNGQVGFLWLRDAKVTPPAAPPAP